jgi:hypothetical protein
MKDSDFIKTANGFLKQTGINDIRRAIKLVNAFIGFEGCSIGIGGEEPRQVDAEGARIILKGLRLIAKKKAQNATK